MIESWRNKIFIENWTELPSQNHFTHVFNTSESGAIIDDAQYTGLDMQTPITSIPDSQTVIEPSLVEMQGTSDVMS